MSKLKSMIARVYREVTPVSGTVSFTARIHNNNHAKCTGITVTPATSSTTYDLKVSENTQDMTLAHFEDLTGEAIKRDPFATFYHMTVLIDNASADELFKVLLTFEEVL